MIKTIYSNKTFSCWFVNTSAYKSIKHDIKREFFATPGFVAENATYVFFLAYTVYFHQRENQAL